MLGNNTGVPKTGESVPKTTENGVSEAENVHKPDSTVGNVQEGADVFYAPDTPEDNKGREFLKPRQPADPHLNDLIDRARSGEEAAIEKLNRYGINIGAPGVYRFVTEGEVQEILKGKTFAGRFGNGRVDVTANSEGSTGASADYRINFRSDFDLYKADGRTEMKNEDLKDGYIYGGYSLEDVESIEKRNPDGSYAVVWSRSENKPGRATAPQSALSRIPTKTVGKEEEPDFTAVDKATALDGLMEAAGGNEKLATDIILAQVKQSREEVEALKKKPPTKKQPKLKGSPMAMLKANEQAEQEYAEAMTQYKADLAEKERIMQAWYDISSELSRRNSEARAAREAEQQARNIQAHDAAVARFEEEQRIKAEKQAEQERIGVHAVNPKIRERWEAAPKIEGNEDALTLPDDSTITGRYILTEAGAASPSHDANNAYEPTEGFPIDENGQSVNDRDYMHDKDAQQIVEGMASSYDNRALQDPVIVSKDGVQTADAPQRGAEPQSVAEPTEAQKAAGNYKMEHRRVDGYNVSIENPKGSVRRGTGADGKPWETLMHNDYGYIRGTEGVDGDHIDVFLSDTPEEGDVFVVDQVNKDGSFDEHKVMYGFPSVEDAREAYLSNYEPGWTGLGAITHVSKDEFKKWIGSSKRKTKPFADYKSV